MHDKVFKSLPLVEPSIIKLLRSTRTPLCDSRKKLRDIETMWSPLSNPWTNQIAPPRSSKVYSPETDRKSSYYEPKGFRKMRRFFDSRIKFLYRMPNLFLQPLQ